MAIVFCSILVQRTVDLCEACKHFCISGHLFCKQFFVVVFFLLRPQNCQRLAFELCPALQARAVHGFVHDAWPALP